jgi:hypothetical protein
MKRRMTVPDDEDGYQVWRTRRCGADAEAERTHVRRRQQTVVPAQLVHLQPRVRYTLRAVLLLHALLQLAVQVQAIHAVAVAPLCLARVRVCVLALWDVIPLCGLLLDVWGVMSSILFISGCCQVEVAPERWVGAQ